LQTRIDAKREKALLECAQHDLAAFEELYGHYFPKVYAYVNYRITPVQEAEDLVATTFLKATERLGRFQWRGDGSFAAWLFRIAHDLVVDFYRQNHRGTSLTSLEDLPELRSDNPLPYDKAVQMEQFINLRYLIGTLSPRRQEIITLRFFGGLRNREIAQMLALDERTVASHLCRGLEDLHRKLANEVTRPKKENVHEEERSVGSARS
jgi:RNA polymerase sigma-70 factor (ECF subfamily)